MKNTAALAAWWVRRNLKPMLREAARIVPLRVLGEALVSHGVSIMAGDGATRAEVDAVVAAAFAEPVVPPPD